MSYKEELKKQIEQLENQVDADKERLARLRSELISVSMKEKAESAFGDQQLLKG